MERLPLVVSVSHGGEGCPEEVADRVVLSDRDRFEDSDALTGQIYDVRSRVAHCEIAAIARAFVDLNRAPNDRPPANPDGVVKSTTDHGVRIYAEGRDLDDAMADLLVERYHAPYHAALTAAVDAGARIGLDCHSMEAVGPPIAPDTGAARPLFCLSNAEGLTCSDEMLRSLGDAIVREFDVAPADIGYNEPFKGGWIVRQHAAADGIPWIQIEMNRSLYLADPWFDAERLAVDAARLAELNRRFAGALGRFVRTVLD